MHLMCRAAGLLLLLTSTLVVTATPAQAAAPGNDTIASALAITPGWTGSVDTSTATVDDTETSLAAQCGQVASNGVWFKYTPVESWHEAYFDSWSPDSGVSNQLGVLLVTGTPDAPSVASCQGWGSSIGIWTQPDAVYYVMVFDNTPQAAPAGGPITAMLVDHTSQPEFGVTFVGGTLNHVGWATVTANVKCSATRWSSFYYTLTQKQGKSFVSGSANPLIVCDGVTHQVSTTVKGDHPFVGGIVVLQGTISGSNYYFNVGKDLGTQQIKLTGGGKK